MKSTRRVAITVETHEVTVLRRRRPIQVAWCPECEAKVEMVEPDEAAGLAGVSSRTIYRWIEAGRLHFAETPKGGITVCRNSIPKQPLLPAGQKPKFPA